MSIYHDQLNLLLRDKTLFGEEYKTHVIGWADEKNWDWKGLAIAMGGYGNMEYWNIVHQDKPSLTPWEVWAGIWWGREKQSKSQYSHSIFKEKYHFDINSNGKEYRIGTKACL